MCLFSALHGLVSLWRVEYHLGKADLVINGKANYMSTENSDTVAIAGSCKYLLTMLLQRLEADRPGLIRDINTGVATDKAAIQQTGTLNETALNVFRQTESLLAQAASAFPKSPRL
jgi:hypothetical protein